MAVALIFAPAACSSHSSGTDAGADAGATLPAHPMDPLAACLAIATHEAAYELSCGRLSEGNFGDAGSGYIGAQCPAALFGPREAAFDAGKLAYDATQVDCVIQGLDRPLPCNVDSPVLNPQCGQLAWGTLTLGQTCDDEYSCGAGLYCLRTNPLNPCGACAADVGLGDACGGTNNGAFCAGGVCNGGACRALAAQGQACALDTAVCEEGLSCQDPGCEPPGASDAGCSVDADCADGLTCNVLAGNCATPPGLGQDCAGQACAVGLGCQELDAGDSCAPLVPGGACLDTDAGEECPEVESCRDGGCKPWSFLGGSCATYQDCAIGGCAQGVCTLLAAGQQCHRDQDCATQRCDVDNTYQCAAACESD